MTGLDRRTLLGTATLTLLKPAIGEAATRKSLKLELISRDMALRPGQKATPAWRFATDAAPRFSQGDEIEVTIANRLPVEIFIIWRGLDGAADLEALVARGPIAAGASETYALKLQHAGTLVCDARLLRHSAPAPLPLLPIIVIETAAPPVDRGDVVLIEDWRLRSDGIATPPGIDPAGAEPIYTVNGLSRLKLEARPHERMRLRFINGTQYSVIAVHILKSDVRVIAIDGQPSEPFLARDGRLVMAPGTRIDAIIDVTIASSEITLSDGVRSATIGEIAVVGEPWRTNALPPVVALPSNNLPEHLPLQSALRLDLKLDVSSGWLAPAAVTDRTAMAFRVARGRTLVLALINPTDSTAIFQLHGHHMRLLDRLDDGWKPFWLDTVAVPGKQTLRVAFAATTTGNYLMELSGTDWRSARLLRGYSVDA